MSSLTGFAARIPIDRLIGLRPQAWLCVGPGFSREDIKALILNRGPGSHGFTGDAITNLPTVCLKIAGATDPALGAHRVLGALGRQEVLRILLAESKISARMPELKRLRRQGNFFRRLDSAMQAGRMAFAHPEEGAVYAERLEARFGVNPVRVEIQALSLAYEAWLEAYQLLDPPLLLRRATDLLNEKGWPEGVSRPHEIHYFTGQVEESLERGFWDALSRHIELIRTGPLTDPVMEAAGAPWDWQLWHTLDDAAEELAQELGREFAQEGAVVLIPDTSSARRSLRRALEQRGIPFADPRDPTRLKWDEGLKWATLPLETVARGYERAKVVSYLRAFLLQEEFPRWVNEIHMRGIRQGLASYAGGVLSGVHSYLGELHDLFGGKKTCAELSEAHLKFLRSNVGASPDRLWIVPFFENLWKEFVEDSERVGQAERKAPALFWWERLQARLAETPAPVERAKPEHGVAVYRLHQAPLTRPKHVYILGLPPQWLTGEGVGDYWFSERERETLSGEFAVRSGMQIRQERLSALAAWIAGAERVTVLDAAYDADGRERESVDAVLRELAMAVGAPPETVPDSARECGAHARWVKSYGALRPLPPQEVQLPALPLQPGGRPPEMTATALDSYSRCGLQAMAYHRWKLRETRDPDTELWPEARGNILHEAVKILLTSRDSDGNFTVGLSDSLEQAWKLQRPKGLLKSARAEAYVKSRMLQVLEGFCEKEREYFKRAPSTIKSLDDTQFRLDFHGVSIVGTPDRIDEHPEGIFVIDYKTSSALPHGTDMVELGYRLQLPFYALAARRQFEKPVLGVQFVELNRKASRGSGIFFKKYNGKEPGKLTQLRANSKSLLALEPEETWARLEESLVDHARAYVSGRFEAKPKRKEKECSTCGIADLCGFRRLSGDESNSGSGGEGGGTGDGA
jgi:RecB family exonuclease